MSTTLDAGIEPLSTESLVLRKMLPDALAWDNGLDLVRLACGDHIRWSYARLREWAVQLKCDSDERVKRLAKAHQQRLVLAPQFSYWPVGQCRHGLPSIWGGVYGLP